MNLTGRLLWISLAGQVLGTLLGLGAAHARFAAGGAVIAALMLATRRAPAFLYAGMCVFGFSIGLLVASLGSAPSPIVSAAEDLPRCRAFGEIAERNDGLGTLARVDLLQCEGSPEIKAAGVIVLEEKAEPGEGFEAEGYILPLGESGFADARRRWGADAAMQTSSFETRSSDSPMMRAAGSVRDGMRSAVGSLDPSNGALLRGLTIGDTDGFDEETTERFRRSGLSHLVAVSGSNVAIVLGAFVLMARPFGLYLRLGLAAAGLVLYVVIVGPEPSVLRAGAMGGVGLLALATGSRAAPLNALALALIVVLALKPPLVHSVGLHMSAAATLGIVLWALRLAEMSRRIPRVLALAAGVTLAAQVAVAPIVIGVFEQMSITGPVANLLAAPAIAPATVLGLAAGVLATVSAPLGTLVARTAEPFAWWIGAVARWFGAESAAVAVPSWVGWALLVPVALLALVTVRGTRTLTI